MATLKFLNVGASVPPETDEPWPVAEAAEAEADDAVAAPLLLDPLVRAFLVLGALASFVGQGIAWLHFFADVFWPAALLTGLSVVLTLACGRLSGGRLLLAAGGVVAFLVALAVGLTWLLWR